MLNQYLVFGYNDSNVYEDLRPKGGFNDFIRSFDDLDDAMQYLLTGVKCERGHVVNVKDFHDVVHFNRNGMDKFSYKK